MKLNSYIHSMRPSQWTKNVIVLAAFVFAFWDPSQTIPLVKSLTIIIPATLLFCIVSSGIYIMNDIKDIKSDQQHPVKKNRAIASGKIPVSTARIFSIALLSAGIIGSGLLSIDFAKIVLLYVGIQIVYSFGLKHVALIDIIVIAIGFVLRAIAGAVVLEVAISPWLLLCTFLLALFLALCKRRHEKIAVTNEPSEQRPNLEKYDRRLLDQLIAITSSATIVAYSVYTLAESTIEKFGTQKLGLTIPFVVFGIFRYLDLAYRHEKGERPEKILLSDVPILATLFLYAAAVIIIFATK